MLVRIRLNVPAALDQWLWKNLRSYRRQAMRKRLQVAVEAPKTVKRCDLCQTTVGVKTLRNGGLICAGCQEGLRA